MSIQTYDADPPTADEMDVLFTDFERLDPVRREIARGMIRVGMSRSLTLHPAVMADIQLSASTTPRGGMNGGVM